MIARSWLFVPGDSERKQVKALASPADALILDLEDSVAPPRRDLARGQIAALLRAHPQRTTQRLWVRVNSLGSGALLEDLAAVMGGAPDGVVLPKAASLDEVTEVHHYLAALEQREGLASQQTRLLVIATETPRAVLRLESFATAAVGPPRLAALTWGAEDLSAAIGAREKVAASGALTTTFELARSLCLLAAAAAGVQPVDGICPNFADRAALARELAEARRDGFTGKLAIHPDQVEPINAAFTPSESEVALARRIVAAFAAEPHIGVTSIDGKMIDRPHLVQAERVLATLERFAHK